MKKTAYLFTVLLGAFLVLPLGAQEAGGGAAVPVKPDALKNYHAGRDLEGVNRISEANTYYNEAVRICMDEINNKAATRDSYTVLAWTLQRQKKYNDVITWADRGLRLYAEDYRLVEVMGEAYFYLDNYPNSLRLMRRYVNALPRGERAATAYFFIGEIYRLQGKFRSADIAYTTAVRLESGLSLWWYRLGLAREQAGEFSPAREAFERAIKLNANNKDAADALARVRARG